MNIIRLSLLVSAMAGLQLAQAEALAAMARVTQGPSLDFLRPRQDICPPGGYTMCADGNGCCELGAPCTTIRGEPACDSPCNGSPCGEAGLCCEYTCSTSAGAAICVFSSSTFDFDFPSLTFDETSISIPTNVIDPTATPGVDDTTTPGDRPTVAGTSKPPLPTTTQGSSDSGSGDSVQDMAPSVSVDMKAWAILGVGLFGALVVYL